MPQHSEVHTSNLMTCIWGRDDVTDIYRRGEKAEYSVVHMKQLLRQAIISSDVQTLLLVSLDFPEQPQRGLLLVSKRTAFNNKVSQAVE